MNKEARDAEHQGHTDPLKWSAATSDFQGQQWLQGYQQGTVLGVVAMVSHQPGSVAWIRTWSVNVYHLNLVCWLS